MKVAFDVLWRQADDPNDTLLVSFQHSFTQNAATPLYALAYSDTGTGLAAAAKQGDLLVLRIQVLSGPAGVLFVPNGGGSDDNGRIPQLNLPH